MRDVSQINLAYQWHPDVHLSWGRERLYFWRLSFFPGFDSKAIAEALTELLEEEGVRSYAAREMFGTVDVVLRAWLPVSVSELALRKKMADRLKDVDLHLIDSFEVTRLRHHWIWSSGAPRRFHSFAKLDGLESNMLDSPNTSQEELAALEHEGLVVRTARDVGITFTMAVVGEIERLLPGEHRRLAQLLVAIIEGSDKVAEPNLYEGTGFAGYLITGRVDGNQINEVTRLAAGIMEAAKDAGYEIKTTTLISHPMEVLVYREELPPKGELTLGRSASIRESLLGGEDAMTEIREAVFYPRYGADTRPEGESDPEAIASFFRSVASFLNSGGGVIVIGAVLRDGQLEDDPVFREAPVVGDYLCVGVDLDLEGKDWASYEQRLENLLEFHIDPSPTPWIEVDHEFLDGRLMVTVRVSAPKEGAFFFVGGSPQDAESFFVRRGDTTIELNRADADAYRRIDAATGSLNAADWGIVRALRAQRRLDRYQLASQANMSLAETEAALDRLLTGGYVQHLVGSDDVPRFELHPHWSGAETPPPRQKMTSP